MNPLVDFFKKSKIEQSIEKIIDFNIQHFPDIDFDPDLKKAFADLIELKNIIKSHTHSQSSH